MGLFSRKSNGTGIDNRTQNLNSSEYDTCLKRISELHTKLTVLETDFAAIKSSLANFRGIINRKLGGAKIDESGEIEKKPEEKPTETINNGELVAFG